MITARFRYSALLVVAASLAFIQSATAGASRMAFEATLVWGTNDPQPADAHLKPVSKFVARKLGKLPFKWKYYYAVEHKEFSLEKGQHQKVSMSRECMIDVKAVDNETVELELRGKGKPVGKVTQKLCQGELLVTGGDAENFTAWFVVLRRIEPAP